ncbi:uncharacterized protein LOC106089090 [Stomoxys calcitrans]|uniref:uncharacterized protein LOC106089090 n=1 Tax=Stomoxys calcitrans TaxID=35570 RepID=UPI0027E39201|nr:uncharacterized protein LOC106089090 [Stomoxys calcitrans]
MSPIMRNFLVLAICANLGTMIAAADVVLGTIDPEDMVVYSQNITMRKIPGRVQEALVNYNPWFAKPVISGVVAENRRKDKTLNEEPTLEIVKGGIGEKSIKLKVKSQEGKGMRVLVKVFGKYSEGTTKNIKTLQKKLENSKVLDKIKKY